MLAALRLGQLGAGFRMIFKRSRSPQDPRAATLAQVAIIRSEQELNDADGRGLINRPKYQKAMTSLTTMGTAAVPTLLEVLDKPRDEHGGIDTAVAESIAEVLGRIGSDSAVERLRELLNESLATPPIALARTGNPAGLEALLDALHDPDSGTRAAAANGLGTAQSRVADVAFALSKSLSDESAHVRGNAAYALLNLGYRDEGVIQALTTVAQNDQAEHVQRAASRALEAIKAR